MRITKRALGLCATGLLMGSVGAAEEALLENILASNHEATIGRSELGKITSIDLDLEIVESGFSLTARYRATRDGRMRIDVFAGSDRVFSEGIDEQGVWEWSASQESAQNVEHDGVGALQHGVEFNLFSLSELRQRGHRIELAGEEEATSADYHVLKVTLKDGFETYRLVNKETWMIDMSRDFRAFHPGIDTTKNNLETRYDQWQVTNGIVRASRSRTYNGSTNTLISTAKVVRRRHNVAHSQLNLTRSFVPDGPPG